MPPARTLGCVPPEWLGDHAHRVRTFGDDPAAATTSKCRVVFPGTRRHTQKYVPATLPQNVVGGVLLVGLPFTYLNPREREEQTQISARARIAPSLGDSTSYAGECPVLREDRTLVIRHEFGNHLIT
jgi:hypothetical protein